MSLRSTLTGSLLFMAAFSQVQVHAQSYPAYPVRMINPNSPGGVSDRMARVIAKAMESTLGQTIIVENKAGASSIIGVSQALRAKPDGYLLGQTCLGPVVILPLTGQTLPFDFLQDAIVVGKMGGLDVVIATRADNPVSSVEELVAQAKSKPGQITVGMAQSPANAIPLVYMSRRTGIELKLVNYRGEVPALTDLLGGTINYSLQSVGVALPQIQSGKIKALQVLSAKRNQALPNVPSFSDTTVPGFAPDSYCVMFVPKGTPAGIVQKLNQSLNAAAKDKTLLETFASEGLIPDIGGTSEESTDFIRDVSKRWVDVAKEIDMSQYR